MIRLLVTGASGQLGSYLLRELRRRDCAAIAWSGTETGQRFGYDVQPIDLTDQDRVAAAFQAARPDTVIHTAALARIDTCHREPERARRVNVQAAAYLAELADRAGSRFVHISTDLVFDGSRGGYRECDPVAPLSSYGQTKAAAEAAVLALRRALVVRVSLMFGPSLGSRSSFFDEQISALRARRPIALFEDEWRTPLSLATAAQALVALASAEVTGLLHLGGPERLSRLEMGLRLAAYLGADAGAICPARRDDLPAPEPRPRDVSLDSSQWRRLFPTQPWPTWDEALRELLPM